MKSSPITAFKASPEMNTQASSDTTFIDKTRAVPASGNINKDVETMSCTRDGISLADALPSKPDDQLETKCILLKEDGYSDECIDLAREAMSGFFETKEQFKMNPTSDLKEALLQVFEKHIPNLMEALHPEFKTAKSQFIEQEFSKAKSTFLNEEKSHGKDVFWHLLILTKPYETQNGGGINGAEVTTLRNTLDRLSNELNDHFTLANNNKYTPISCAVEALAESVSEVSNYSLGKGEGISTGVYTSNDTPSSFISASSSTENGLDKRSHTFEVGQSKIMLVHNEAVTNTDKEPKNLENFFSQVREAFQAAKDSGSSLPIVGGDPNINVLNQKNRSKIQDFCTDNNCVFVHPKDGYSKGRDPANPWKNPQLKKGVLPGNEIKAESMGAFIPKEYFIGVLSDNTEVIAPLKEGESVSPAPAPAPAPNYNIAFKDIATDHVPLGPIIVDCSNGDDKPQMIRFTNDGEITHRNKGLKENLIYNDQKLNLASFKLMIDIVNTLKSGNIIERHSPSLR